MISKLTTLTQELKNDLLISVHAEAQAFSAGAFPPMGSHIEAGNGFGNGLLDLSAGGAAGSAAGGAPDVGGAAGRAPAGAPGGAPDMGGALAIAPAIAL